MGWNVAASIQWLINNSVSSTLHKCANYVRQALEAGGISTAGRPQYAKDYATYLPTIGFNNIGSIHGAAKQKEWSKTNAKPGDIAVMNHDVAGHICMWTGNQWVSDFKQNNMWVYGGDGTCSIFRYNGTIDGSLDAIGGMGGTITYKYDVPRDKQEDNLLFNELSNLKLHLLMETLESAGIMFTKQANSMVDVLKKDSVKYNVINKSNNLQRKIVSFYNKQRTFEELNKIQLEKIYNTYIYYKSEPLNDLDYTVSETIVEKAVEWGLLPGSFGGNGDMAAAFGDLYELALSQCDKYLQGAYLARATEAVYWLVKNGLTKQGACAAVGIFLSENGCEPHSVCKGEHDGSKTNSYTANGGYGAGIASWTGVASKQQALSLIKSSGPIESLSMQEQCKMYYLGLGNGPTAQKIKSGTLEEATVAAMFKTHGDSRDTLRQYGYTYKAAYEEQIAHTPRIVKWNGGTPPSVYHRTALLTRVILGGKLMELIPDSILSSATPPKSAVTSGRVVN